MIQNVLSHIGGVGNYGVIAVLLFFGVFAAVLVWTLRLRRPYLDHMSRLPLEGDEAEGASLTETLTPRTRHE